MLLTYFTVSNYRSITTAYKLDLKNVTIIIGKNNEGKSNLIKALNLAMEIIHLSCYSNRQSFIRRIYNWNDDFPLQLQNSKKLKKKTTDFRLDFSLDDNEVEKFRECTGSTINGELSIFITIKQDCSLSITIPKKGKNAAALTKKIAAIASFIYENITLQYIPAIRSESDAYNVINNIVETELSSTEDEQYKAAEEYIEGYRQRKLKELSEKIKNPLSKYMPRIKDINLCIEDRYIRKRSMMYGKEIIIEMDDGVKTRLSQKGDGVKSLTAMAILSQTDSKNRIIIVEEPENHLHPEAIRYLRQVLYGLSEHNQVIISTHNPIFINRSNIKSNIIVDKNQATPANRVDELRKLLGVMLSDNLVYSDFVVVVEGLTDQKILKTLCERDETLKTFLSNNTITIRSIGGTNNLQAELYSLERYLCHYIVVLDNDEAGRTAAKEAKEKLTIDSSCFRYFFVDKMRDSELEDLIEPEVYKAYLLSDYQIDINNGAFKNKSKKWSTRIKEIAAQSGRILDNKDIDTIKQKVSELAAEKEIFLNATGSTLFQGILGVIKQEVEKLMQG